MTLVNFGRGFYFGWVFTVPTNKEGRECGVAVTSSFKAFQEFHRKRQPEVPIGRGLYRKVHTDDSRRDVGLT